MRTEIVNAADDVLSTGHPNMAHVVQDTDTESAQALVLRARVTGRAIQAICGVVYTPVGDPARKRVCRRCEAIYDWHLAAGLAHVRDPRDLPI